MKITNKQTVEQLFPNPKARKAADEAIYDIPEDATMRVFLDAWEGKYFEVAGVSPFRKQQ